MPGNGWGVPDCFPFSVFGMWASGDTCGGLFVGFKAEGVAGWRYEMEREPWFPVPLHISVQQHEAESLCHSGARRRSGGEPPCDIVWGTMDTVDSSIGLVFFRDLACQIPRRCRPANAQPPSFCLCTFPKRQEPPWDPSWFASTVGIISSPAIPIPA